MPTPDDYLTKGAAIMLIRERTGFGRFVVEKKMTELEIAKAIRFLEHPGNERSKLIRMRDVEKIIAALSLPPPD
jgi:hypothetical protein